MINMGEIIEFGNNNFEDTLENIKKYNIYALLYIRQ